ncbi:MAG: hypothetical protein QF535_05015 [Anaerolineales bacterium]|jgi:hypothetical protein|nr:hypothetical protein [Anaerolineales bacterium]
MKLVVGLLVVLLSLSLVSAEVSYTCSSDSDCELYTDLDWSCVEQVCVNEDKAVQGPGDVRDIFDLGEETCDQEGCLSFAPVGSGSWFSNLWYWLVKV